MQYINPHFWPRVSVSSVLHWHNTYVHVAFPRGHLRLVKNQLQTPISPGVVRMREEPQIHKKKINKHYQRKNM